MSSRDHKAIPPNAGNDIPENTQATTPETNKEVPSEEIQNAIREIRTALMSSKEYLESHKPNSWTSEIFNNLKLYLPGKIGKKQYALLEEMGLLDNPMTDSQYTSEFAKSRTTRQFYQDVSAAVAECGIDMNRVDELLRLSRSRFVDETDPQGREYGSIRSEFQDELKELFELLKPIYTKLRLMGYSHYDITGSEHLKGSKRPNSE